MSTDGGGVSPTLCVGAHSGVMPKILVYEDGQETCDETSGEVLRQG